MLHLVPLRVVPVQRLAMALTLSQNIFIILKHRCKVRPRYALAHSTQAHATNKFSPTRMLSRKVASLVCPLHSSSTWAEMAVVLIKGSAAVVCEVGGVLADEPPQLFLFAFFRAILKQQLAHICHIVLACESHHLSHHDTKLAMHRFTTHGMLIRLGRHSAKA